MYRGVVTDFDSRRNGNVTDNLHADLEPGDASYIYRFAHANDNAGANNGGAERYMDTEEHIKNTS